MSHPVSLPRKIARVLLPCVGWLILLSMRELLTFRQDLPEATERAAKAVLYTGVGVGSLLALGLIQRLRRQLRTRSRYFLWTVLSAYFLGAIFLVGRFGSWSNGALIAAVLCVLALGGSIWGATAERQRTIEYTLFPRRPKKTGQAEKRAKQVEQGA